MEANNFEKRESPVSSMKAKEYYLADAEHVDRSKFRMDILRCAREQGVPVSTVLASFFENGQFTKKEMGTFALNTSSSGNLVEGAVALMHALGVTEETAETMRILEDYIGVSETDPQTWGASWVIDSAMNWPPGTSLASSRAQLAKL
ncbi:MAG: hypothetical protein WCV85_00690 [Patescibacteria group bacterium]|jgi:hypothetical protein